MAMTRGVLLAWLLLSGHAQAEDLHKCVGPGGAVSYQSAPCAEDARTLWVRPVTPDPVPARPTARVASSSGDAAPRRASATGKHSRSRPDARAERCAAARRAADITRDRLWNRLSFKQRSELDADVERACAQ